MMLAIALLLSVSCAFAQNSSIICLNNATLKETLSVDYVNSSNLSQVLNSSSYVLNTNCQYGCDNVTKTCSPDPFTQNIYMFVIFIGMSGLLILIYKVF